MAASESEKSEKPMKKERAASLREIKIIPSLSRQYVRNSMTLSEMSTKLKGSCSEAGKEHNQSSQEIWI